MTEDVNRQCVRNLLDAFYAGNLADALACCSDDVDFVAHAPIDILPHLGHRHGKAEVEAMWKIVHARYSNMRYDLPVIVAEGDKVAAHIRVFFRKSSNDRVVQFDIADFYTLRDGRVTHIHQFLDSFDLVQQVLERDVAADLTDHKPYKT